VGQYIDLAYECAEGVGRCSASSANWLMVRTTRSTFSRKEFRDSRAKRTVNVEKDLDIRVSGEKCACF